MCLDLLVFCDCGFHSVCPLMEKDKREVLGMQTLFQAFVCVVSHEHVHILKRHQAVHCAFYCLYESESESRSIVSDSL